MLDLLIIPPQPVDAEDVQKVPFLDGLYEPCVLGPVEILAGLFIHVDVGGGHALFVQCDHLAYLVLVCG